MTKDKTLTSVADFRLFLRDAGVRSFDQLATRFADPASSDAQEPARRGMALARLARLWSEMDPADKQAFFDQMIVAAELTGQKKDGKAKKDRTADLTIETAAPELDSPDKKERKKKKKKEKKKAKKK